MLSHRNNEPVGPHAPHRSLRDPRHRLEQPARVFEPHREVIATQPPGDRGAHRRCRHVPKIAPHVDALQLKLGLLRQPRQCNPAYRQQRERNTQPGQ